MTRNRVTRYHTTDINRHSRNQSNFHAFYYFYDGLEASGKLNEYCLPSGRRLRYLRIADKSGEKKQAFKVRNNPQNNALKFEKLMENFKSIDMEEHCETIRRVLAAILLLGEIRFVEGNHGEAELNNDETANKGNSKSGSVFNVSRRFSKVI